MSGLEACPWCLSPDTANVSAETHGFVFTGRFWKQVFEAESAGESESSCPHLVVCVSCGSLFFTQISCELEWLGQGRSFSEPDELYPLVSEEFRSVDASLELIALSSKDSELANTLAKYCRVESIDFLDLLNPDVSSGDCRKYVENRVTSNSNSGRKPVVLGVRFLEHCVNPDAVLSWLISSIDPHQIYIEILDFSELVERGVTDFVWMSRPTYPSFAGLESCFERYGYKAKTNYVGGRERFGEPFFGLIFEKNLGCESGFVQGHESRMSENPERTMNEMISVALASFCRFWDSFSNREVAIFGCGHKAIALSDWLKAFSIEVVFIDQDEKKQRESNPARISVLSLDAALHRGLDCVCIAVHPKHHHNVVTLIKDQCLKKRIRLPLIVDVNGSGLSGLS